MKVEINFGENEEKDFSEAVKKELGSTNQDALENYCKIAVLKRIHQNPK